MKELDSNETASWHLLQLSLQGRPVETVAQFLASYMLTGEMDTADCIGEVADILDRVRQLMEHQNEIWPGLLPGPPTHMETHDRLTHAIEHAYHVQMENMDSNPSSDVRPFDYRMRDMNVERIIPSGRNMWQVEGYDLDGNHVWIQLIGNLLIQQP